MSRKISAPNIISGTHGKVWWDDSVIYEISSFEATLDTDREDVTFAGDMIKDSKLMSVSGTSVSYTHLTLPRLLTCRSRWSPYH